MSSFLSRAHRRFLALTLPPQAVEEKGDFLPLERVSFTRSARTMLGQLLATAGITRGGVLLGYRDVDTLYVSVILPNGYGVLDPFQLHGQYVLGALDVVQQVSERPLDWLGYWLMPASGLAPDFDWVDEMWPILRLHALVPSGSVFVAFGMGSERLEVIVYCDDSGELLPLDVVWEGPAGEGV